MSLAKKLAVASYSYQHELVILNSVDQKEVAAKMAFLETVPVTTKLVISVVLWQGDIFLKALNGFAEPCKVSACLLQPLELLLKLLLVNNFAYHDSRSAMSSSTVSKRGWPFRPLRHSLMALCVSALGCSSSQNSVTMTLVGSETENACSIWMLPSGLIVASIALRVILMGLL